MCHGWQVKRLHSLDLNQLQFVGEALTTLRREVEGKVSHNASIVFDLVQPSGPRDHGSEILYCVWVHPHVDNKAAACVAAELGLKGTTDVQAAVLGFVGSPWTLATYIIEGKSSALYKTIKTMLYNAPEVLDALLSHLADQIATYVCYQISSGAHAVQLFDSWGGQLPPQVGALCLHAELLLSPAEVTQSCLISMTVSMLAS